MKYASTAIFLVLISMLFLIGQGDNESDITENFKYIAEPGRQYSITFSKPVDKIAVGTVLTGVEELSSSPLIFPHIIILKADDLPGDIYSRSALGTHRFQRYIKLIKKKNVATSLGLIVSTLLQAQKVDVTNLRNLAKSGNFEIFLHGYSHYLNPECGCFPAEFEGSPLNLQTKHINWALNLAKMVLGIDLHTFDAPGNRYDDNTLRALRRFSSLKVWLFGPEDKPEFFSLPRNINIERRGVINPEKFQQLWRTKSSGNVQVLQLHPGNWEEKDFSHFEQILDFLIALPNWQFMTPYEYYQFAKDLDNIKVTKVTQTRYILDCTEAKLRHTLNFTATPKTFQSHIPPTNIETVVKNIAGVHQLQWFSLNGRDVRSDVNKGIVITKRDVLESKKLKFERGEYIIDIFARNSSTDPQSLNLTLKDLTFQKNPPLFRQEFSIKSSDFVRYSSQRFKIYAPIIASVILQGGEDIASLELKNIVIRRILRGEDRYSKLTFYSTWSRGHLALISRTKNRKVGFMSDKELARSDKWYHIAVTFDRTCKIKFYIDGELAGADTISMRPFIKARSLILGAQFADGRPKFHFNGTMDDIRISNKALTGAEIKELFQQGQEAEESKAETKLDLVKYWNFSEGEVQTSSVKIGDENVILHGDWENITRPSRGLQFDGVDDYIEVTDSKRSFTIANSFTISAWIKPNEEGRQVLIQATGIQHNDSEGNH